MLLVQGAATAQGQPIEPPQAPVTMSTLLSRANEVELALSAGPEHLLAEATVYVFGDSGYARVKAGSNGFSCLVNRDGWQSGDQTLRPTCWDAEGSATILPVMLRVGELLAQRKSADEVKRDVDAGFSEGGTPVRTRQESPTCCKATCKSIRKRRRSAVGLFRLTT